MLEFDPEIHQYRYNGRPVPNVTQILPEQNFSFISDEVLKAAIEEGKRDHDERDRYIKGEIGIVSERIRMFDEFLQLHQGAYSQLGPLVCSEEMLYSKRYGFAGRPDQIFENGIVDGKRSDGDRKIRALQFAGYHILAMENGKISAPTKKWIAFHNGRDRLIPVNVYSGLAQTAFIACLQKWRADQVLDNYFATA